MARLDTVAVRWQWLRGASGRRAFGRDRRDLLLRATGAACAESAEAVDPGGLGVGRLGTLAKARSKSSMAGSGRLIRCMLERSICSASCRSWRRRLFWNSAASRCVTFPFRRLLVGLGQFRFQPCDRFQQFRRVQFDGFGRTVGGGVAFTFGSNLVTSTLPLRAHRRPPVSLCFSEFFFVIALRLVQCVQFLICGWGDQLPP